MALNIYELAVVSYGTNRMYQSVHVTVANIVVNICKVCWRSA